MPTTLVLAHGGTGGLLVESIVLGVPALAFAAFAVASARSRKRQGQAPPPESPAEGEQ